MPLHKRARTPSPTVSNKHHKNFVIDDKNIHWLVKTYFRQGKDFPESLRGIAINDWDVSRVTNMIGLFIHAEHFNESINDWDVSRVTNMESMFHGCSSFNQPLDRWANKVHHVTTTEGMFSACTAFNQNINTWELRKIRSMGGMFAGCIAFDQPVDNLHGPGLEEAVAMLQGCVQFNQPMNRFVIPGRVSFFFDGCRAFNQPLNHWTDRIRLSDCNAMFRDCASFHQDLSSWRLPPGFTARDLFQGCPRMLQDRNYQPFVQGEVDILQIHKEASKVNKEALTELLQAQVHNKPDAVFNGETILHKMTQIIDDCTKPGRDRENALHVLKTIYEARLRLLKYDERSQWEKQLLWYCLMFVQQQPIAFQKLYVASFLKDCIDADGRHGMSCANGVLERIYLSLEAPCVGALSALDNHHPKKNTYDAILDILLSSARAEAYIHEYMQPFINDPEQGPFSEDEKNEHRNVVSETLKTRFYLNDKNVARLINEWLEPSFHMVGGRRKRRSARQNKNKTQTKKNKNKKRHTRRAHPLWL